jgi:predicted ATP-grasp superfamily ATP-dependent carboligase
VPGRACSIGLIGKGNGPAELLLPAEQQIEMTDKTLHYVGGRIPCESEQAERVTQVAEQVRNVLGGFRGYLGIDLIVPSDLSDDTPAVVIEVNPRLCTSYTGYRSLCRLNLAEQMLAPAFAAGPADSIIDGSLANRAVNWRSGTVTFRTDGTVLFSDDQER